MTVENLLELLKNADPKATVIFEVAYTYDSFPATIMGKINNVSVMVHDGKVVLIGKESR